MTITIIKVFSLDEIKALFGAPADAKIDVFVSRRAPEGEDFSVAPTEELTVRWATEEKMER
jgi:hypothetical protein